jgi:hypothetical protein
MAWTSADVDRLKAAIASGTRSVQYADKSVSYQSTEDMLKALQAMESEVAGVGAATSGGRCTFASFKRD